MKRYAAFGLVGALGFLIDAAILTMLTGAGLDPFVARLISIAAAMACTWMLNRTLTFGASDRALPVEAARYGGVALLSAGLNYAVYSALLLAMPRLWPLAALVAASGAAMLFSYLGYSRLVFTRR